MKEELDEEEYEPYEQGNENPAEDFEAGVEITDTEAAKEETDAEDTTLQVIIGGGLSQKYRVGDTIVLDYGEGTPKEALVIGNPGSDFYMLNNGSFNALSIINISKE